MRNLRRKRWVGNSRGTLTRCSWADALTAEVVPMHSTLSEIRKVNEIIGSYELPSGKDDCEIKIEEISEMRERLMSMGFARSFLPSNYRLPDDVPKREAGDIKRQMREMRYGNYLKRKTLMRLDYAMASHKIALAHFSSGALPHAYRNLPYDGSIIERISEKGVVAARAYLDIYEMLNGDLEQLGMSVEVAVPSDEGVKYERLQLYGVKDAEEHVHGIYGKSAEVIRTKIITKHRSVLTSRAYRKVLACAYAVCIGEEAELESYDDPRLEKYLQILRRHGIVELVRADAISEPSHALMEELEREGMVEACGEGDLQLSEDLGIKLSGIISRRYWNRIKRAYSLLAEEFIKLVMLTTRATRKGMGVFSFDDDIEIIKPITEKAGISGMARSYEMIKKKLEIEEKMAGFATKNVGLAVFAHYQGRKRLESMFGITLGQIRDEIELVGSYIKGGRGDKFLAHLKKR